MSDEHTPNPEAQRRAAVIVDPLDALAAVEKALEDSSRRLAERLRRGVPPGDALHDHNTPILTDKAQREKNLRGE